MYMMFTLDMDENDTNVLHFKKNMCGYYEFHFRLEARKVNLFCEFFNKIEVVASHTRWTIHSPKQILSGINAFWKQCVVRRYILWTVFRSCSSFTLEWIFWLKEGIVYKFWKLTCIHSINSIREAEWLRGWRVLVDIVKYQLLGIDAKGNVFLLISVDVFRRGVSLQNLWNTSFMLNSKYCWKISQL